MSTKEKLENQLKQIDKMAEEIEVETRDRFFKKEKYKKEYNAKLEEIEGNLEIVKTQIFDLQLELVNSNQEIKEIQTDKGICKKGKKLKVSIIRDSQKTIINYYKILQDVRCYYLAELRNLTTPEKILKLNESKHKSLGCVRIYLTTEIEKLENESEKTLLVRIV